MLISAVILSIAVPLQISITNPKFEPFIVKATIDAAVLIGLPSSKAARKYALITDEIAKMSKLDLGGSEPVAVTVGGKTYSFPNQAAADKFKAQAGIK